MNKFTGFSHNVCCESANASIVLLKHRSKSYTVKPLFSRGSIFRGFQDFVKICENSILEKLPNSIITVGKKAPTAKIGSCGIS